MTESAQLERLLRRAADDPDVLAVMLFGSAARGDATGESDTDVCLILTPSHRTKEAFTAKRLAYLGQVDLDVQVFQDLPLYIRPRVLAEGRVLFCRDEDALYEEAFRTIRSFQRFKRTYHAYLDEVARGRS